MDTRPAVAAGLVAGGSHLLLSFLIQTQNFFAVVLPDQEQASAGIRFLATLPFLQLEHLAVAGAVGVAVSRLWATRAGCVAAVLLLTLMNGYLVLDQISFGAFAAHLHPSLSEEWPPAPRMLLDSVVAEAGPLATANALLVVLASAVLGRSAWRADLGRRLREGTHRAWQTRPVRLGVTAYLVASIAATSMWSNDRLEVHPLLALLQTPSTTAALPPAVVADADLFRGRDLQAAESAAEREEIAAARTALHQGRPNVVLLVLESIAAPQLLDKGRPRADRAPVLARLATEGIVFDQIYTTAPFTLASHLYMHTGGDTITVQRDATPMSPFAGPTLAGEFAQAGYRTAFMTGGDLSYGDTIKHIEAAGYQTILHAGSLPENIRRERMLNSWGVDDALVFTKAKQWVRDAAAGGEPFFLQVLTLATHHPFTVPKAAGAAGQSRNPGRRYIAGLAYTDALFGELIETIRREGLLGQTVFAVTGDHGQPFSEVHLGRAGHGRMLYDESIRTFLVLAAPMRLDGAHVSHRLGTLGDIMPTLASLAGRLPPSRSQDLLAADRHQRIAYFHTLKAPLRIGLRDGRWKFIGGLAPEDPIELYDLAGDPKELKNVAADRPDLVATYGALTRSWHATATQRYLADAGVSLQTVAAGQADSSSAPPAEH